MLRKKLIYLFATVFIVFFSILSIQINPNSKDKVEIKTETVSAGSYVRPLAVQNGQYCCVNTTYSACSGSFLCSNLPE
ncbi:MAG: hypothetical protein HQ543_05250 [Bacteroidetes bacterium]|nr:hypothetical protein [Bacteroidota bacterium]